jgi:hypothetical protein
LSGLRREILISKMIVPRRSADIGPKHLLAQSGVPCTCFTSRDAVV